MEHRSEENEYGMIWNLLFSIEIPQGYCRAVVNTSCYLYDRAVMDSCSAAFFRSATSMLLCGFNITPHAPLPLPWNKARLSDINSLSWQSHCPVGKAVTVKECTPHCTGDARIMCW